MPKIRPNAIVAVSFAVTLLMAAPVGWQIWNRELTLGQFREAIKNNDCLEFSLQIPEIRRLGYTDDAIEMLIAANESDIVHHSRPRGCIYEALTQFSPESIPALERLANSHNADLRSSGIFLLGQIGPPASSTLPTVRLSLRDSNPWIRFTAATAMMKIDPYSDSDTIQALTELLGQPGWQLQSVSASELAEFGERADAATPQLLRLLRTGDPRVRGPAARALAQISGPTDLLVAEMITLLENPKVDRSQVIEALASFGPGASEGAAKVAEFLDHEDIILRNAAEDALRRIHLDAKNGIETDQPIP